MATTSFVRESYVKFYFSHSFPVSELSVNFDENVYSPVFKTVHANIGFKWRLVLKPQGGRYNAQEYRDHVGFFIQPVDSEEYAVTDEIRMKPKLFVEVGSGHEKKKRMHQFSSAVFKKYKLGGPGVGCPKFLPIKFDQFLIKVGFPQLGVIMTMDTCRFSWEDLHHVKLFMGSESYFSDFIELFKDVATVDHIHQAEENPLKKQPEIEFSQVSRPAADECGALDFQVFTNDSKVIWCHKAILIKKCAKFHRMCAKKTTVEAQRNQHFVQIDSNTMMEVVQFIYEEPDTSTYEYALYFDKMDFRIILDAAKKYELEGLKLLAEDRGLMYINLENAADFLEVADLNRMKILREFAINLIAHNIGTVLKGRTLKPKLFQDVIDTCEMSQRCLKYPSSPQSEE